MHTNPTCPPLRRRATAKITGTAVVALTAVLTVLVLASAAGTAYADTATASASALNLSVFANPVPAPATVSNDGTQATQQSGSGNLPISLLPANGIVGAGALGQLAVARADGSSSSCAGLVAPSSALTIAPNGACSGGSATSGVTLDLGALAALQAGSITASCNASSSGQPSGSASLVNARVTSLLGVTLANLPVNPAPNTGVAVAALGTSITLNRQTVNPDGSLSIVALQVTVAGTGIEIGRVTCGPNLVAGDVPVVPAAGLPIVLGLLALGGGAWWCVSRRAAAAVHVVR